MKKTRLTQILFETILINKIIKEFGITFVIRISAIKIPSWNKEKFSIPQFVSKTFQKYLWEKCRCCLLQWSQMSSKFPSTVSQAIGKRYLLRLSKNGQLSSFNANKLSMMDNNLNNEIVEFN